ncbi:MAG: Wzz/FepE/Etk N-terminal domain-containing protein [candidate division Zixibacteria bacterium]|jgi:uncharacterized protein involved in exopolysaccharide biosynthesis|nr:Wzz/FepE/Etk N-terminal domain-containing protein [candidate division Zixibacteria bacterium]
MDGKLHVRRSLGESSETIGEPTDNIDLLLLLQDVIRRRRTIVVFVCSIVALAALWLFTTPNRYTSYATILPSGQTEGLASLRSLVGLGGGIMPTGDNSSFLFPNILSSQLVRDAVLDRSYEVPECDSDPSLTLATYFGETNPDRLREKLAGITEVSTDSRTGQIRVSVETIYPTLSQQIVTAYVDNLERYNREKRASAARENATYLAGQLSSTQALLQAAEDSLRDFRNVNRDWAVTSNPDIMYELSRLQRSVNAHLAAYQILQENYQMAQFEAMKDVPIVRVLDEPSLPTEKSGPRRLLSLVAIALLSTVLSTIGVVAFAGASRKTDHHVVYRELRDTVAEAFPRSVRTVNRVRKLVDSGFRVLS